ncbi:MAG: 6-bladed beta-propeller [Candidatus Taylorbacteria bacterium]
MKPNNHAINERERERERERELESPSKNQSSPLRRYVFSALLIVALLLVGFGISYAATFTSSGNGNWNIGTTWGKACVSSCTQGTDYPGQNDLANISSNTVTLSTNQSVGSTTLSGTGILNLGSYILSVYNNWTSTSTGTFNGNTGTVNFAGTNQYIFGTTTFNNLTKTVSSADSLSFPMSTTTVSGNLTLGGATGTPLTLQGFEENYIPSNIGTSSLANGVLNQPVFLAIDSSDNIYVADTVGQRIEKFDSSGNFISKFGSYGTGNGQFVTPYGIAVDPSNNVYVADSGNNRIEKFDSSGNYVTQWGTTGTGAGQFSTPRGIGIATSTGDIYVVDSGNNRIQLFNSSGTFISTFGYGVATGASSTEICTTSCRAGFAVASTTAGGYNVPYGVAVNSSGNAIYVADYTNNRIVKSDLTGNYLVTWGKSGSTNGSTTKPYQISLDNSGNVYIADSGNTRIEKFDSSGNYISKFGSYGSGNGQFNSTNGVVVDSLNNVYGSDPSNLNRVEKFNSSGTYITNFGLSFYGNGTIYAPTYLTTDSSGNLYVSDSGNNNIYVFGSNGNYISQFGGATSGTTNGLFKSFQNFGTYSSNGPRGIAIDHSGNILVSDTANSRVEVFSSSGVYQTQFASSSIYAIATDSSGNVYTAGNSTLKIQKFNSSYNLSTQWGCSGAGDGCFTNSGPLKGIAVDPNGSYVYVSDGGNNRIEKFDSSGNYILKWGSSGTGNGKFNTPEGLFVDSYGFVYVADYFNNRVQKFDSNGNYITQWGSYGTGAGQFIGPTGVTGDSSGNVYVSDFYNNRIQEFHNLWQISGTGSTSIAYATVKDSSNYGTAIKCFNCTDGGSNVGWSFITATPPTLAVATSSNIASSSVTLNSGITSDGNASSTIIGFNYGTSISYGSATSTTGSYGNGYFSMNLIGLPCGGTAYHYQSFATNAVGTGTSSDATFTTGSCTSTIYPPTIGTATSSSVTYTTATLTDTIATDGGSASTIAGFNYGTSTSYGSVASTTGTYSAGNQWNLGVTGLTCSTTYHFQGYATNSGGTGTSSDQIFTTATCPISITGFSPSGDQPTWTYYTNLTFTTNEAATCKYATTSATTYAAISMSADTSSTTHSWPITDISSGHSYTYYPFCKDAALYENPVTPIAFNIPADTTAPDLVNVSPTFIYFDTAIIQWNTTEPSDTLFEYGTSASLGTLLPLDHSLSIPHAITLTGLAPGTTYYYQVTDKDKTGNSTSSPIQSFTTLSQSYAQQYYISKTGSDSNTGTIGSPFATLEKGTVAARTWRTANPSCSTPIMIWLRGGDYYRDSYLYLSGIDAGTTNCPTIFSGYPGENAVITGSKDISGFSKITSDDPNYARLGVAAQANVYAVSLSANGVTDYGDLTHVAGGSLSPPELIFNGKVMTIPRYPNDNANVFRTTSFSLSGSDPVLGYGNDTEPTTWAANNDIWVHGWFKYDWSDYHQRVKSFDLVNNKITLDSAIGNAPNGYMVYDNCCAGYFYFENVFEELNTPGEYYIDRNTGTLYFWPPSDINSARTQITTATHYFVHTYHAANIIFQNLTFENNRAGAFYFAPSFGVSVVHSVIHNIGSNAILATGSEVSTNSGVYNSHIYDIGSFGVSMGGNHNFAINNKIHNTGRWDVINFGGIPIYFLGTNQYVSHNEVYNQLNGGIYFSYATNDIVEYNNVHDVNKMANDMGGIYFYEQYLYNRGSIVKYNYVHDIYGVPWMNMANGIYFDNFSPGNTAYGNVLATIAPVRASYRPGGAFMVAGGRDNIIDNNIVVNSQNALHLNVWDGTESSYRNSLATSTQPPYSTYFPETTMLSGGFPINPEGTVISRNIFDVSLPWNTISTTYASYVDVRNDNLLNTEPLFVDAANNNFNLQAGSPAYALGFQDIPFNQIGLMNSSDAVFNEISYSSSIAAPSISTVAASVVSTSTATLNASITATGGADATQSGFAYGTSADLSTVIATSTLNGQTGTTTFNQTLTGLTPNTIYYFRAYAVNSAGTSTGSILSFATSDTTAPTVNVTVPSGGATVSGSAVTLTSTATDDVGVVGVQFKLDSTTDIGSEVTSTSSPNTYTTTWDSTAITSYGSHTLYAVARDAAGNHSTSTVTVNVDNVAPTIVSAVYNSDTQITVTLSKLANAGTITKSNDGGFTVTKTGAPGTTYAVSSIAPGTDNTKVVLTVASMTAAGGAGVIVTYSHSGNGTVADTLGNLLATDGTGITVPPWNTVNPTITNITSSVTNGAYKLGIPIDINLTFSKTVNTAGNITITLNTGGTCTFSGITNSTAASCTYTVGSGENTPALNVSSVSGPGTITSTDGNLMTSFVPALNLNSNRTLTIDTIAPAVSLTTPGDGSTVSGTSVTLSATNSDGGSGIASVQFVLDGTTNIGSSGSTNPYSITWNSKTTTSASHTLAAVARDAAGNYATSTITVTVKNTAPSKPTSVTAATSSPNQASVSFLAPTDDGGATITGYTVTSNPSGGTDVDAGTTALTHIITGLTNNAAYTFTVTATNSNGTGNASDPSNSVTPTAVVLPTYLIGGTISGLSGTVILQNNSGDNLSVIANGSFTFASGLHNGDAYNVTVLTQPYGQTCTVSSGSGTVSAGDVMGVSVTCSDNAVVPTPTPTPSVTMSYSSSGGGSTYVPPIMLATTTPTVPGCPSGFICKPNPKATVLPPFTFTLDISSGSSGDEVLHLQQLLNSLAYLFVTPTGYFGPKTEAAVKAYQTAREISPLGIVGPITRASLNRETVTNVQTPIINISASTSTVLFTRNLGTGSQGDDVKALQVFLNTHGFTIASSGAGSPGHETITFGSATKAALMKFQIAHKAEILTLQGLTTPTGFFGLATMRVVNAILKSR